MAFVYDDDNDKDVLVLENKLCFVLGLTWEFFSGKRFKKSLEFFMKVADGGATQQNDYR